jgi:hypothetical protein
MIESFEILDFIPYENVVTNGIKIWYPSYWEKLEEDENKVTFSSPPESEYDSFQENLLLSVYPAENRTLNELFNHDIDSIKQSLNSEILESNNKTVTLAGSPAYKIVYNFTYKQNEINAMRTVMVKDDKSYHITYFAKAAEYEYYLPTIQSMIDSFQTIEFLPYENVDSLGVGMKYASNWKIIEEDENNVRFSSPSESEYDSFQENLLLSVYPAENRTLNDILVEYEAHFEDFQIIKPANTTTTTALANNPAHMIVFSFTEDGVEYKAMKVISINDDKVYDIIYVSEPAKFDTYLPTIQKMIESFEILDFIPYEN